MADPSSDVPSDPGPSLSDIQRALDEQYTDAVRTKALRFAERRVRQMRWSRQPVPKNYAKELAHDAYTSIWLGVRRWDPSEPLYLRLRSLIKERTSREMTRAKKYEHLPLDLAANDSDFDPVVERALAASSATDVWPLIAMRMATLARQVVDEMYELADEDEEVRAILGCWERGFTDPEDVMALTGLSESQFKNARERILRLAKRLPPELREAAQDLLRSA